MMTFFFPDSRLLEQKFFVPQPMSLLGINVPIHHHIKEVAVAKDYHLSGKLPLSLSRYSIPKLF